MSNSAGNPELQDGDYYLRDGAAWLEVKGYAVRVRATEMGVEVEIYATGLEMNAPLARAVATDEQEDALRLEHLEEEEGD